MGLVPKKSPIKFPNTSATKFWRHVQSVEIDSVVLIEYPWQHWQEKIYNYFHE